MRRALLVLAVVLIGAWFALGRPLPHRTPPKWAATARALEAPPEEGACAELEGGHDLCLLQAALHTADPAARRALCEQVKDPVQSHSCLMEAIGADLALDAPATVETCREAVPELLYHCLSHGVRRALGENPFPTSDPAKLPAAYNAMAWRRSPEERAALGAALGVALGPAERARCAEVAEDMRAPCQGS